jgi:hypothetical protein
MNIINGRHIGFAQNVISMTQLNGSLIALTSDHKLLSRSRFEEDKLKPWTPLGDITPAGRTIATASLKTDRRQQHSDWTYIATTSDRLIRARFPNTQSVDFGEANRVLSMAISGSKLYAATNDKKLWRRDALTKDVSWDYIGHANDVVAMGAFGGVPIGADYRGGWLVAATNDGNTSKVWMRDNLPSNTNWVPIADFGVNNITAMTAVSVNHWSREGLRKVPVPI